MIDIRLRDAGNNEIRIQDGYNKVHILIRSPEFENVSYVALSIESARILIKAINESINNENRDNINT